MTERPGAVRRCRLIGAMVTGLGVVGLVFLPAAIAGEATPTQVPPALGNDLILLAKFEPWMIMLMVLGILAALMGSLLMVYWYIARVRTTEIHRQLLLDAVRDFQYRKLMGDRSQSEIFDERWTPIAPPNETLEDRTERLMRLEERNRLLDVRYQQYREAARREAEVLVPQSLSVAGMGITGTFFIELTAILTIIFGILILGLLGVLGTREISPILAAIAGYVLGKTTAGQTSQAPTPAPQAATSLTPQVGGSQSSQLATPRP